MEIEEQEREGGKIAIKVTHRGEKKLIDNHGLGDIRTSVTVK